MSQAKFFAGFSKGFRDVARAVVCHNSFYFYAELPVILHCCLKKSNSTFFAPIGHHLDESDPGVVVYANVNKLPASSRYPCSAVAMNTMANTFYSNKFFNIDMEEVPGFFPFISAYWILWSKVLKLIQSESMKCPKDRGTRHAGFVGYLFACPTLSTK